MLKPNEIINVVEERKKEAEKKIIDWFEEIFSEGVKKELISPSGGSIVIADISLVPHNISLQHTRETIEIYSLHNGWDLTTQLGQIEEQNQQKVTLHFSPSKPRTR